MQYRVLRGQKYFQRMLAKAIHAKSGYFALDSGGCNMNIIGYTAITASNWKNMKDITVSNWFANGTGAINSLNFVTAAYNYSRVICKFNSTIL